MPTDKLFTGQRLDATGLYYYNARYYDPQIGRFISADTIIPHPANPQSFARYSYCLNNPFRYIDPNGHWTIGISFKFSLNLLFFKIEVDWSCIADSHGNIQSFSDKAEGLTVNWADEGVRLSGSASVGIEYTDAPTIKNLGEEIRTGIEAYWEVGGYSEYIQGQDYAGRSYGIGVGYGAGIYSEMKDYTPVLPAVHAYDQPTSQNNVSSITNVPSAISTLPNTVITP